MDEAKLITHSEFRIVTVARLEMLEDILLDLKEYIEQDPDDTEELGWVNEGLALLKD